MKSNCTSMKEMQQLMAALREVYTDVRLLDAETLQQIQEGARTDPHGPDFCYACRHKDRFSRHCAAKQALADRVEHCRLEICGDQAAHITARYYEVDGQPYVLELTKSAPLANIIGAEDSEALMSQASGHNMRFYHDPLTGVYNRRYYEDVARASIGPAGVSILDMDNLEVYNDTYGRQAGDLALGTAANVIRGCIRQTDTLIRYGGDKFLLILPGIPREHPDVFFAEQAGADPRHRGGDHPPRLPPSAPFAEHRCGAAGFCGPAGRGRPPCRFPDVPGKSQKECHRAGGRPPHPAGTGSAPAA